jgi:hypothetical protein
MTIASTSSNTAERVHYDGCEAVTSSEGTAATAAVVDVDAFVADVFSCLKPENETGHGSKSDPPHLKLPPSYDPQTPSVASTVIVPSNSEADIATASSVAPYDASDNAAAVAVSRPIASAHDVPSPKASSDIIPTTAIASLSGISALHDLSPQTAHEVALNAEIVVMANRDNERNDIDTGNASSAISSDDQGDDGQGDDDDDDDNDDDIMSDYDDDYNKGVFPDKQPTEEVCCWSANDNSSTEIFTATNNNDGIIPLPGSACAYSRKRGAFRDDDEDSLSERDDGDCRAAKLLKCSNSAVVSIGLSSSSPSVPSPSPLPAAALVHDVDECDSDVEIIERVVKSSDGRIHARSESQSAPADRADKKLAELVDAALSFKHRPPIHHLTIIRNTLPEEGGISVTAPEILPASPPLGSGRREEPQHDIPQEPLPPAWLVALFIALRNRLPDPTAADLQLLDKLRNDYKDAL